MALCVLGQVDIHPSFSREETQVGPPFLVRNRRVNVTLPGKTQCQMSSKAPKMAQNRLFGISGAHLALCFLGQVGIRPSFSREKTQGGPPFLVRIRGVNLHSRPFGAHLALCFLGQVDMCLSFSREETQGGRPFLVRIGRQMNP